MASDAVALHPVESGDQRDAARRLILEYLRWVAEIARARYGLAFDVDAMVSSDIDDTAKFYPPTGRFYLVACDGGYVGVGCLKRLDAGVGEIQRMYIQPHIRGRGAGRMLVERLLADANALGYATVRLESLKALDAAHALYRSVGFVDVDPYSGNSMRGFQAPEAQARYLESAVFMEFRAH